jgi:hypothetical protein
MKTSKMPYSVLLQSLMSEVKKQEDREKKNVINKIVRMYKSGENINRISIKLKLDHTLIKNRLMEYNLI